MEKKSFIFYENWFEGIEQMPDDIKAEAYRAVMRYGLYGEEPAEDSSWAIRMLFIGIIKHGIDDNVRRYEELKKRRSEAGKKGGGNPNFRKGQPNPYYRKDNSGDNSKDNSGDNSKDNSGDNSEKRDKQNINKDNQKDKQNINKINLNDNVNVNINVESTYVASVDKENTLTSIKEKTPPQHFPYDLVAKMWNDTCGDLLPRVIKLGESRKLKIKARFAEFDKDLERQLKKYEAVLNEIADSSFCTGHNSSGWTATFDWLFDNGKNWVKVLEGNYNDDRRQRFKETKPTTATTRLGAGEYRDPTGRRTYGTGKTTIPEDAPPRPSERYSWNATTRQWIL